MTGTHVFTIVFVYYEKLAISDILVGAILIAISYIKNKNSIEQ